MALYLALFGNGRQHHIVDTDHALMYQAVTCSKGHEPRVCALKEEHWLCSDRRKCLGKTYFLEPLLTAAHGRTANQVFKVLYGITTGNSRLQISTESGLGPKAITRLTNMLELIISLSHDMRRSEAEGTGSFMQKDETCFSKAKRGGNNRVRRLRADGSQWVNVVVKTNRYHKAEEVLRWVTVCVTES